MKEILEYYKDYDEEIRLEKDNLHKIEYLTTIYYLDQVLKLNSKVLDVSAGTGRYSFYLADKGHIVTSRDIVPKHVNMIKEKLMQSKLDFKVFLGDARDLSQFESESFDVVLCMGPIYHLKDASDREKTISECLKVLKKGGIIVVAYINRYAAYLINFKKNPELINSNMIENLIDNGNIRNGKENCFYFSYPEEIEKMMGSFNVAKIKNIATDGISYMVGNQINDLNDNKFRSWMEYQLKTCENQSLLGYSLHNLYIGEKYK